MDNVSLIMAYYILIFPHHCNPPVGEWNIVLTDMPGFLSGMGAKRLQFTKVYVRGDRATYSKAISREGAQAYSEVSTQMVTYVQGSAKRRELGCVNSLPGSAWL